jgi:hypothetical protein
MAIVSLRSSPVFPFIFLALACVTACANPLEEPKVAERFQEIHGCPPSKVYSEGDRWIAEGCGERARFTCVNKYADAQQNVLFGGDTCVQESSEPLE